MESNWMLFGLDWLENLQAALPDWVFSFFEVFSFMGSEEAYIVVLVAVWAVNYSLAMQLGIILMVNNPLNITFKMLSRLPRPYWANSLIKGYGKAEIGFGFPSGHSQTPLAFYGYFATQMKKKNVQRWIWLGVVLIGLSRYVLGMHFPLDVLAGWVLGALFLWLFLKFRASVSDWILSKSIGQQVSYTFILSIALLALPVMVSLNSADYLTPIEWQINAHMQFPDVDIAPMHFSGAISAAATLFGLGAGGFWLHKNGGFKNTTNKGKQLTTFIIGLVGLLVLKEGLGAIFPGGENLASYAFRYLRYTLIGMWISGLAPSLLIKWRMGDRKG